MSVGSQACHKMKASRYKSQRVIKRSVKLWVLFTGFLGVAGRKVSVWTGASKQTFGDEAELKE